LPSPEELKFNVTRYCGAILADAFLVEEQLLKLALADSFWNYGFIGWRR
jgi:hypothetical protein